MPLFADRIAENTISSGDGTITLDGAVVGFEAFRDNYGDGVKVSYVIRSATLGGGWEIGIGTLTFGSPDTLSRDTVLASSNGDSLVVFDGSLKNVLGTFPAAAGAHLATSGLGAARPFWLKAGGLWVDAAGHVLKSFDGATDLVMGGVESIAKLPGKISNESVTPDEKIDIAGGTWRAEDAARNIVLAAITIDIMASGDGGLLSGSLTADTPYAVLSGINTVSGLAVAGFAPSVALPATWSAFRYHGTVYTDATSDLLAFTQLYDRFIFDVPILDVPATASQGTTEILRTLSVALGRPCVALVMTQGEITAGGNLRVYITHPDQTDESAAANRTTLFARNDGGATFLTIRHEAETNASRQVRSRANVTLDNFTMRTIGWIDTLGRDQ